MRFQDLGLGCSKSGCPALGTKTCDKDRKFRVCSIKGGSMESCWCRTFEWKFSKQLLKGAPRSSVPSLHKRFSVYSSFQKFRGTPI